MLTQSVKQAVKDRDKRCVQCGTTENLTIDHILPLTRGGSDAFANLQTLCRDCNQRKGFFRHIGWVERVMIWLHCDELIERTRNEFKSIVSHLQSATDKQTKTLNDLSSRVGALQKPDNSGLKTDVNQALSIIHLHQNRFVSLETKLQLLEKYLKVELISGTEEVKRTVVETVEVKKYRKVK